MSEEKAGPYVHLLEGRDPAEVMRTTPSHLIKMLMALTPEAIEQRPGGHRWTIRESLCHMADLEVAWAWRLRMIYGSESPVLQPFEQDAWARAYQGSEYTTEAARSIWIPLRRWNMALIDGLSAVDKQRPATHPELGSITLWNVVEIAAGHDLHHISSLEKIILGLTS